MPLADGNLPKRTGDLPRRTGNFGVRTATFPLRRALIRFGAPILPPRAGSFRLRAGCLSVKEAFIRTGDPASRARRSAVRRGSGAPRIGGALHRRPVDVVPRSGDDEPCGTARRTGNACAFRAVAVRRFLKCKTEIGHEQSSAEVCFQVSFEDAQHQRSIPNRRR